MNKKRAVQFAVLLYALSLLLLLILRFGFSLQHFGIGSYSVFWIVNIPLVLLCAKWFFKEETPTTRKGALLGIITLVVGFILDILVVFVATSGNFADFKRLYFEYYGNVLFYVTLIEIFLLCVYAGFEFDATYTKG